jgi:hypothetical protein
LKVHECGLFIELKEHVYVGHHIYIRFEYSPKLNGGLSSGKPF